MVLEPGPEFGYLEAVAIALVACAQRVPPSYPDEERPIGSYPSALTTPGLMH